MESSSNKLGIGKNKRTFGALAVLVAIPVFVGLLSFVQQRNLKNSQVLGANQVDDILGKIGKLIDIPDETPTVATVSDVTKLSGQEFFAKAANGDKVIIFPKAQKAILYRPETNKIIEVAFYSPPAATPGVTQGAAVATPAPTQPVSLRELLTDPTGTPRPSGSPPPTSGASIAPTSSAVSPTPQQ